MSPNVTRHAILYATPKGHAFELQEERPWNHDQPFATLSRVLVAKVTWEGSLVVPDPLALAGLPDPPEKASWKLLGHARGSAWRLLMLADQVQRVGAKSAANLLRRQATWLPCSGDEQPAVLAEEDVPVFRVAARSMRGYMIWAVRFARLEHVLAFWAAGKIVRGELLLHRQKHVVDRIGAHDKTVGKLLEQVIHEMSSGDVDHIVRRLAMIRAYTLGEGRSVWKDMIDALPFEAQALVHGLLKDLDAYAFKARL